MAELALTPATELAALIRAGRVSPVEAVEAVLAQIAAVNPAINAYCTVLHASARAAAREAEAAVRRGDVLGPLHGVPVALKDVIQTEGVRTTYGSPLFQDYIPVMDEIVVTRLKAAGAIVVGKTNTPELAAGIDTVNPLFGTTRNPWNRRLTAGGSSGGSAAALAAGMAPLALGSDHGGSLRIPAAHCGVVGFRTSAGVVPQYPNSWVQDPFSVTGPMARTVADTALLLSVLAGPDERVPISLPEPGTVYADAAQGDVAGWRVAWSPDLGVAAMDPEVLRVCEGALGAWRELGCVVDEGDPGFSRLRETIDPLRAMRTAAQHQNLMANTDAIDNPFVRSFLSLGASLSALDVGLAEALRARLWDRCVDFFRNHDLLVTPATQTPPFPAGELYPKTIDGQTIKSPVDSFLITYAISMTGLPAISVPCGFTESGLPVGLQIVGRWRGDAQVLRAAAAFERARPWAHLWPPLGA
ncbi:MAG: amidase [Chloroflexota bacterium]